MFTLRISRRAVWLSVGIVVLVGTIAVFGASMYLGMRGGSRGKAEPANAPANVPANLAPGASGEPSPVAAQLAPPIADLQARYRSATEVQWDAYRKSLKGARVEGWEGSVAEVSAVGNAFKVTVALINDSDRSVFDIAMATVVTENPDAVNWSKGAGVVVSGNIRDVTTIIGMISIDLYDGGTVSATR